MMTPAAKTADKSLAGIHPRCTHSTSQHMLEWVLSIPESAQPALKRIGNLSPHFSTDVFEQRADYPR